MPGPFNASLHPHGFHGFWSDTGGRRKPTVASRGRAASGALRPQVDLGPTAAGRPRARAGSGQTYRRGPAAGGKPAGPSSGAVPVIHGQLKLGATVRVMQGQGAAAHVETAKVTAVQSTGVTTSAVTLATSSGSKTLHVSQHPASGFHAASLHGRSTGALRPRPSGFVNHQQIKQWWAGHHARFARPLPYNPAKPPAGANTLGRPGAAPKPRVLKDAMTVTEDLGHDGQSPVTVLQGGRTLARCPECGYRLSLDGHCPKHGVVAKLLLRTGGAVLRKDFDQTYIPSTGEARAPKTTAPTGRKTKKSPQNLPVGDPACPDCGGTDGYHAPNCPRNVLNPGGAPAGLGAS